MADAETLLETLAPVLAHLAGVDCDHPGATAALNAAWPLDSDVLAAVRAGIQAGLEAGWLTPRGGPGLSYGRLAKATPATRDFSIDAVHMDRPGPEHTHPNGEIDLCFALAGEPTFDGHPPGWVVLPKGSRHVPTVAGGDMAILYFLPGGAIQFHHA